MEGFLDLNYSQNTPHERPEESLKQTMIDYEIVFKKQVHELHLLCEMQKSLMKRKFTESHKVDPTRFILNNPFLPEKQDFCSRIHQSPLDLRLSTSNFCNDDDLCDEELNLSLSIGINNNKRSRIDGKSWKNKILYPPTRNIIDLEESLETGSSEDAKPVLSVDQSNQNNINHYTRYPFRGLTESLMCDVDLHQDHLKKDPSCGMNESLMNDDLCHEWGSINQVSTGSNKFHGVKPDLDLNKDQPDESSFHSNEQSDLSEEKTINIKKEDPDHTLDKAALSLILLSTTNQDYKPKSGSNEITTKDSSKNKTTPRSFSIDSYESLVLKLEESGIDEDTVTSKAFEINELGQKDNGVKLRRGRRMKDFQKDVLPILSCLSRHEIWEDINILEGVIRSREYKRMNKAKMKNGEKWFVPLKNKRSKVNYVGSRKEKSMVLDGGGKLEVGSKSKRKTIDS